VVREVVLSIWKAIWKRIRGIENHGTEVFISNEFPCRFSSRQIVGAVILQVQCDDVWPKVLKHFSGLRDAAASLDNWRVLECRQAGDNHFF
jgi:hypothetical protein